MTRILSLLLTLLMLLGTFTACQNKKPQEKVETPPQTEPSTELPEEPAMSEAQALYEKAMALAAGGYYLEQKVTVTTPENPDYILDVLKTKVTKNGGNCTVYSGTMDNFKEMTYVDGTLYAYTKTIGWNDIIKKYKKQCSLEKALAEIDPGFGRAAVSCLEPSDIPPYLQEGILRGILRIRSVAQKQEAIAENICAVRVIPGGKDRLIRGSSGNGIFRPDLLPCGFRASDLPAGRCQGFILHDTHKLSLLMSILSGQPYFPVNLTLRFRKMGPLFPGEKPPCFLLPYGICLFSEYVLI